jgi:hypothetical protein
MSNILEGMTEADALGCIVDSVEGGGIAIFVYRGKYYVTPSQLGLNEDMIVSPVSGRIRLEQAIRAYYSAKAASKWIMPEFSCSHEMGSSMPSEDFYLEVGNGTRMLHAAEITRTNARRWLEEFARLNPPKDNNGILYAIHPYYCGRRMYEVVRASYNEGEIRFTEAAAKHIIDNKPELLRAMEGRA